MITITFPDGAQRSYEGSLTGDQIAESISKRLVKEAVACRVNGELYDLNRPIAQDAKVEIITRYQEEGLEVIRHDTAHLIAEAVKELYPETQITIGPAIKDGFYYDFARETPFSIDDFSKIEQRMKEIVERNEPIVREEWGRDEAIAFFLKMGEFYKAEIIKAIPAGDTITLYRQGGFIDLCRGPHLPSTGRIGTAFKLMSVAGAYWRGDSNNPMLQRIYGTAWADQKQLDEYLFMREEAERRDHRKIGKEMHLFHTQEEAAGSIFWHPQGWTLYKTIEEYIRQEIQKAGYVEVKTPQILDRSFWEASGHWEQFREAMFTIESKDETLAIKPMNCPCHIQIFKQGMKSYRDLPLRMAEFGSCHRNEPSGALHGLMRVRAFTQDDAHIFCTEDQITAESIAFCNLLLKVYKDFGFENVMVKFSDRPEKRVGSDAVWDKAETALKKAVEASGLSYTLNPGEGAFYGPKLEFVLRDAIGRDWQCGTLQVDFNMPERLGAYYIGEDGEKHRPVMLHRAILGSFERFIGILIEHYAGKFPLWLAPTQVVVAPITQEVNEYGEEVLQALERAGIRARSDLRNEKISYKIREHSLEKVPLIFVIGKREAEQKQVVIRKLGIEQQETLALQDAIDRIKTEKMLP